MWSLAGLPLIPPPLTIYTSQNYYSAYPPQLLHRVLAKANEAISLASWRDGIAVDRVTCPSFFGELDSGHTRKIWLLLSSYPVLKKNILMEFTQVTTIQISTTGELMANE